MALLDLVGAGFALLLGIAAGTIAHEWAHAATLGVLGVPFELTWVPDRHDDTGPFSASILGRWATVRPQVGPERLSPWRLRIAALAPLTLTTPLVLVGLGVLPNPFLVGNSSLSAAAIGWLSCALPSPQDFALVWHAEALLERLPGDRE